MKRNIFSFKGFETDTCGPLIKKNNVKLSLGEKEQGRNGGRVIKLELYKNQLISF